MVIFMSIICETKRKIEAQAIDFANGYRPYLICLSTTSAIHSGQANLRSFLLVLAIG